jgi:hypothetical protein
MLSNKIMKAFILGVRELFAYLVGWALTPANERLTVDQADQLTDCNSDESPISGPYHMPT